MSQTAISYLFVPASRRDRYSTGIIAADRVIVDLEDAVSPEQKAWARQQLVDALEDGLDAAVYVRVNAIDSSWCDQDLEALAALTPAARAGLAGVMLPKTESRADLDHVQEMLGEIPIIALVETARGLSRVRELAAASTLSRFALGAVDLSFDIDVEIDSATIDHAYALLVLASRLADLPAPIASPPLVIHDAEGVEADARRLRSLGATAQLCIHPAQVAPIHAGMLPSGEQREWAKRVLAVGEGASQVDGQMVDKPVQERARRILSRGAR